MGHLTNFSLNKESKKFVNNNNFQDSDDGTKQLFTKVLKVLEEMGVDLDKFNDELEDICTKLTIALRPHIVNHYHIEIGPEGETNQNCFHILGLDLMIDEDHKLWVLEINCFPSFNYFFDKIVYDQNTSKKMKVKTVSEVDKYIKTLIIKEAILITKDEQDKENSVFKQVYPPENKKKYSKFAIYDNIRKVFENLAYPKKPDYITQSQFEEIATYCEEQKHIHTETTESGEEASKYFSLSV